MFGVQGRSSLDSHSHHDPLNWFEIMAVAATGVLHLILQSLGANRIFIGIAGVFWIAYIALHVCKDSTAWAVWGFRTDNLLCAAKRPTLLFILAGGVMIIYGTLADTFIWRWHMLLLFLLYPLWGMIQQFLVQALVVANLVKLSAGHRGCFAVSIGAVLFGAIHYPYPLLMLATCGLGFLFIPCYLRYRNLWPLGLYHGWLGTLFYICILGRDPWLEVFG
jgi:hypothetical protein